MLKRFKFLSKINKYLFSSLIITILVIISCSDNKGNKVLFGKLENGENIYKYLLTNGTVSYTHLTLPTIYSV